MNSFYKFIIPVLIFPFADTALGQQLFPVKIDRKWGLINPDGKLVIQPIYDAIGEFDQEFKLTLMQKNGLVGVFDQEPKVVIEPQYEDIKILEKSMLSVKMAGKWKVVNIKNETILNYGFDDVEVLSANFLRFKKENLWGIVNRNGEILHMPSFNKIKVSENGYFLTFKKGKTGLLNKKGKTILNPDYEEIKITEEGLFFHKKGEKWGAVDANGNNILDNEFQFFRKLTPKFYVLNNGVSSYLFSVAKKQVINNVPYENYFPFPGNYILVKKGRALGLMDENGNWILEPAYTEIQPYGKNLFRTRKGIRWGLLDKNENQKIPFEYDYIAPLKGKLCMVKKDSKFGAFNIHGEKIIEPNYSKIEFEKRQAKAYNGNVLTMYELDAEGRLVDENSFGEHITITIGKKKKALEEQEDSYVTNLVMEYYEWYYDAQSDKWGLRDIQTGENQIVPVFDYVRVEPKMNLTLVGTRKPAKLTFDRTTFRFEMVFGLVENITGKLISNVEFRHIELSDFRKGNPMAHVILETGKHGLILRSGSLIVKDLTYIGNFSDGMARIASKGKLSGKINAKEYALENFKTYLENQLSPSKMVDFTAYDRKFQKEADLTCDNCLWGYIDTLGKIKVEAQFDFAKDYGNEVCIVKKDKKWGAVNYMDKQLIPFEFDEISFLEKTGKKVIRVYKKESKYGLIDTLGQIQISAVFDDIGSLSEGKLAVKRNNVWGFVNGLGTEIIPCRFQNVGNFSEGLVAVKIGNQWGYADKMGEIILKPQFTRCGNFNNDLTWFYNGRDYGYIDKTGAIKIKEKYQKAFDFQFKVARVVENGKFGLIDPEGDYILRPKYSEIGEFNDFGLAKIRYGSDNIRYGLINIRGEQVTERDYREIKEFRGGFAAVKFKDKYGFINLSGELVIPAKYSKVSDFSEGFASVQIDGRCGYIDSKGKWFVDPTYSRCLDFKDGIGVVYMGLKRAGLIKKEGKLIVEPQINRLLDFSEGRGLVRDSSYRFYYITEKAKLHDGYYEKASKFEHGVAVVQMDGKWGIINQKGIEITPPKYDKISTFEKGYAKVRIKGFSGLTNTRGETIVQPDYEYIHYAGEGLFRVEQGDKVGYFDSDGNWVWNLTE